MDQGGWTREEDELRVRWAFAEARRMLQLFAGVRDVVEKRMAAGTSFGGALSMCIGCAHDGNPCYTLVAIAALCRAL